MSVQKYKSYNNNMTRIRLSPDELEMLEIVGDERMRRVFQEKPLSSKKMKL